jgi:xanthine dehydrogenase YagS FAD-binding subunit
MSIPELTPRSIPDVKYVAPTSIREAVSVLNRFGQRAKVIAGGSDLLYLMKKDREAIPPQVLVDIKRIGELKYLEYDTSTGLRLGALTTVNEIEDSTLVQSSYPVLAQAASVVASPQIRNVATVGGALSQQVWCWFLREGRPCWRAGDNICSAVLPGADNRYYHSVMGGRECYAVHPSDLAVALKALDATVTVAGPGGTRTMTFDQFLPGNVWIDGVLQSHILRSNEIVTGVQLPALPSTAKSTYVKVAVRDVFDFAIASLALVLWFDGSTISDARAVFGGVAPTPHRDRNVEDVLKGKMISADLPEAASQAALRGAEPLENNAYKIDVSKGVVKEALMDLMS